MESDENEFEWGEIGEQWRVVHEGASAEELVEAWKRFPDYFIEEDEDENAELIEQIRALDPAAKFRLMRLLIREVVGGET